MDDDLTTTTTPPDGHLAHPRYRRDIDGLRAVAVLSVVIFHAYPNAMRGGYIGVDVFFVISGFLISTILLASLRLGTFSLSEFYSRRVNRIFPALAGVLLTCLVFARFLLTCSEFAQMGKHVAGGAGFVSNIVLWTESGYFDAAAETKPLLHLWSLGIEEQFYIVWPLLLWATWKARVGILPLTAGLAAASFALNVFGVHQDIVATFYLPLTRCWELLAGSLLAWQSLRASAERPPLSIRQADTLSIAGLALIVVSLAFLTKDTLFPGWPALMPVAGAVALIGAGPQAWVNRVVLSNRLAVWFGLISFPLYLWHWPLLALAKLLGLLILDPTSQRLVKLALICLSILLSWLTFAFVERPLRARGRSAARTGTLVATMSLIFAAGLVAMTGNGHAFGKTEGHLEALNARQLTWNDSANDACRSVTGMNSSFCILYGGAEDIEFAVIGDSTGNHLAPGLAAHFATNGKGLIDLGTGTCPPIRGLAETSNWGGPHSQFGSGCLDVIQREYAYVLGNPRIRTVVLAFFAHDTSLWSPSRGTEPDKDDVIRAVDLLEKDIGDLERHGKRVIVTYDAPIMRTSMDVCLRPMSEKAKLCRNVDRLLMKENWAELFQQVMSTRANVTYFSQMQLFERNGKLRVFDRDDILLLRDNHHLSYHGSALMGDEFAREFPPTSAR